MSIKNLADFNNLQPGQEYLGQRSFLLTLLIAFLLHLSCIVAWGFAPQARIVDIPVRTLNIKLGDDESDDEIKAAQPAAVNNADVENTISHLVYDQVPAAKTHVAPAIRSMDKALGAADKDAAAGSAMDKALSEASAAPPRQFVRDKGMPLPKSKGSTAGSSTQKDAEMVSRYEQLISMWIRKFQIIPPEARTQNMQGDTVVRIRIDRQGNIRYYILEHSTGFQVLDRAAIDMIRRANPVPAVPNDYPSDELMEFLIPVSFKLE
jgi:TonB family protein